MSNRKLSFSEKSEQGARDIWIMNRHQEPVPPHHPLEISDKFVYFLSCGSQTRVHFAPEGMLGNVLRPWCHTAQGTKRRFLASSGHKPTILLTAYSTQGNPHNKELCDLKCH